MQASILLAFFLFFQVVIGPSLPVLVAVSRRCPRKSAAVLRASPLLRQGFLRRRPDMAPWVGWAQYISFPAYAFNALMVSEFRPDSDLDRAVLEEYGLEDGVAATKLGAMAGSMQTCSAMLAGCKTCKAGCRASLSELTPALVARDWTV